jgi:hypothetical protein
LVFTGVLPSIERDPTAVDSHSHAATQKIARHEGTFHLQVNLHCTLTPSDIVRELLQHMEKKRIFRDLFGVQSWPQRKQE